MNIEERIKVLSLFFAHFTLETIRYDVLGNEELRNPHELIKKFFEQEPWVRKVTGLEKPNTLYINILISLLGEFVRRNDDKIYVHIEPLIHIQMNFIEEFVHYLDPENAGILSQTQADQVQ